MARTFQINSDGSLVLPTGVVDDESATALRPLGVTKTKHLHHCDTDFGQDVDDTPATKERVVYRARGAATVRNFRASLEETGTSTDIDYQLKKYNDANPGGVSILSADVNITHATADRAAVAGTVSSPVLAAGDVVTILQTVTSATGAAGPWAEAEIEDDAV